MVAGIELGKEYAQVCVKTAGMTEPESVTKVAGAENYRIPTECDPENKEELQIKSGSVYECSIVGINLSDSE